MENKNKKQLESFVAFCNERPQLRFWQALRSWAGVDAILISKDPGQLEARTGLIDTFYMDEE